jgi:hypothetical protein
LRWYGHAVWLEGEDFQNKYDYGHHRVEKEREDQDEAGQKAYEKKLEKGVWTKNNVMTEDSGKWISKDTVERYKPKRQDNNTGLL